MSSYTVLFIVIATLYHKTWLLPIIVTIFNNLTLYLTTVFLFIIIETLYCTLWLYLTIWPFYISTVYFQSHNCNFISHNVTLYLAKAKNNYCNYDFTIFHNYDNISHSVYFYLIMWLSYYKLYLASIETRCSSLRLYFKLWNEVNGESGPSLLEWSETWMWVSNYANSLVNLTTYLGKVK